MSRECRNTTTRAGYAHSVRNPLKREKEEGKGEEKKESGCHRSLYHPRQFHAHRSRPYWPAACFFLLRFLEAIRAVHAVGSLGLGDGAFGRVQDILYQVLGVLYTAADAHKVIEDSDTVGDFG